MCTIVQTTMSSDKVTLRTLSYK